MARSNRCHIPHLPIDELDPVSLREDTGRNHAVELLHIDTVNRAQGVDGFHVSDLPKYIAMAHDDTKATRTRAVPGTRRFDRRTVSSSAAQRRRPRTRTSRAAGCWHPKATRKAIGR